MSATPPSSGFWLDLNEHKKNHSPTCRCMENHPQWKDYLIWCMEKNLVCRNFPSKEREAG